LDLAQKIWFRLPGLRWRIIIPYAAVTFLTAAIGLYVITRLVVGSTQERFLNQLTDASRVMADGLVQREQLHLDTLRRYAFTEGVAQAIVENNRDLLVARLGPLLISDRVDVITIVNQQGIEIVSLILEIPADGSRPTQFVATPGGFNFLTAETKEPLVAKILSGEQDEQGDKFAGLFFLNSGSYLFTSAPVVDTNGDLAGVIMMGSQLDRLLVALAPQALAQIAMVINSDGSIISASTLPQTEEDANQLTLSTSETSRLMAGPLIKEITINNAPYQMQYAPLRIRNKQVAILGVALSGEYVVARETTDRGIFVGIFTVLSLFVVFVGLVLYQNIVSPLLRLRQVSQAVAAGDLERETQIRRSDEIGELATSFDVMTGRLRERTAEIKQLYQEAVDRSETLADINARLQNTQNQLVQSEKLAAVGQLTAGIVHDVKNPLAVIKGLAEILQEEDNLQPFMREQLTNIRDNASRANAIVNDLLTFARQSTPEMQVRDIRETVRASLRLTEYLVRRARVNASIDLPAETVTVQYDPQQIEQVLINLIQNATQAMPNGGDLALTGVVDGTSVVIKVRDTGMGIPPENLRRIFDPFFTTKGDDGTGLGLSVSYGIMARHHGNITVESQVGEGTTFTMTLPLHQPASEQMGELTHAG
jgi:signal transduction histidine kinase